MRTRSALRQSRVELSKPIQRKRKLQFDGVQATELRDVLSDYLYASDADALAIKGELELAPRFAKQSRGNGRLISTHTDYLFHELEVGAAYRHEQGADHLLTANANYHYQLRRNPVKIASL